MSPEIAADLARQALVWIASDEERVLAFVAQTGAGTDDLRGGLEDPTFLGSVLDALLLDEPALLVFCDEHAFPYDRVATARAALPGGDIPNWT